MERVATWNNVGTEITRYDNVQNALEQCGLDYEVEKRPLFFGEDWGSNGTIEVPNRFVTVRTTDNHPYDVVSDKFEIVQNRDAFEFVNYVGGGLQLEKAGETASGIVYIIGRLPGVNVLGDSFTPYVLFRNGFNGKTKISAAVCPLRIVCQNQFNVAFKETENTINLRHVSNINAKLVEARETLAMVTEYMDTLNGFAERMAKVKLNMDEVVRAMDIMFPIPSTTDKVNSFKRHSMIATRNAFIAAYDADDNTNFKGTAWGLINAYTDFMTHRDPQGSGQFKEENKFITSTFGKIDNRIVDVIMNVAAA